MVGLFFGLGLGDCGWDGAYGHCEDVGWEEGVAS